MRNCGNEMAVHTHTHTHTTLNNDVVVFHAQKISKENMMIHK